MDNTLYEEHIAELREAFSLLDTSGQGRIPTGNLNNIIRTIDPTAKKKEIISMTKLVDPTDTGYFGFDEFLTAIRKRMREPEFEDDIYKAFKFFDKDGDGYITVQELRHLMTNVGEKYSDLEITEIIREADLDNKGKVDFEDIIKLMTHR